MDVKFYGGVDQIGGNKILVRDRKADASVFLDFGMNFTESARYFEEFVQPRTANGIVDFLEMGILPRLDGIYRPDLLRFAGMPVHKEPVVDAVVLSHAHLDHSSHIAFLDEAIPVYCNGVTYGILKAIQETGRRSIASEIVDFKNRPIVNNREPPVERRFELKEDKFKIGGLEIEMIPVDHSVPGATGIIVYGSDKTLAYSGDLRTHGTNGHLTRVFVERVSQERPDVFLCEGTRIDETDRNAEIDVHERSTKVVAGSKGLVVADFAFKDTTRFATFLQVARENKRRLAIEFKDAYYIREISKLIPDLPQLSDDSLLLYEPKKRTGTYDEGDYEGWEREFLDRPNTVRAEDIRREQAEIVIALGFYDAPELIDLKPPPSSIFIKSASEAFNEEQEFDMTRLRAWLDHFGVGYEQIHASGHAPRDDLGFVMRESRAKTIVPIHTEHADLYSALCGIPVERPVLSR